VITLVEGDVWRVRDVTTGSGLPAVWVRGGKQRSVEAVLQTLRGCVTVGCALLPSVSPDAASQHLLTFVVEAPHSNDADVIAQGVGPGRKGGFVGLGVASGPVCLVMIARSFVSGIESHERGQSLNRFEPGLSAILAEHGLK
jgi:hypothetical protein